VVPAAPKPAAPPAAKPAPAGTGDIRVRTIPERADVFVDGERRGVTPKNLTGMPFGTHTIRVTRPGYQPRETDVTLGRSNLHARILFKLKAGAAPKPPAAKVPVVTAPALVPAKPAPAAPKPAPAATPAAKVPVAAALEAPGDLDLQTRPPGARVFVDGRVMGVAPLMLGNVSAGSHTIRFELDGFKPWSTTVVMKAGSRARISASLERSTTR
jgi:hypothetical protein